MARAQYRTSWVLTCRVQALRKEPAVIFTIQLEKYTSYIFAYISHTHVKLFINMLPVDRNSSKPTDVWLWVHEYLKDSKNNHLAWCGELSAAVKLSRREGGLWFYPNDLDSWSPLPSQHIKLIFPVVLWKQLSGLRSGSMTVFCYFAHT
jgi:hypothetical protein